jgi:hypothetical protein
MALTITHLSTRYCNTEGWFNDGTSIENCPYIVVNCTFKCSRDGADGSYNYAWGIAKGETEEYKKVLTIDDPKRYEAWISDWDLNGKSKYPGYGRAWIHHDQPWYYLEKFDTFWLREWIADCGPTRAILHELEYYKKHGKLPSVYRAADEGIILSHLETLQRYWD